MISRWWLCGIGRRPDFFSVAGDERLDAEAHRPEAGRIQPVQQIDVEAIQPRLGLERQRSARAR